MKEVVIEQPCSHHGGWWRVEGDWHVHLAKVGLDSRMVVGRQLAKMARVAIECQWWWYWMCTGTQWGSRL